MNHDDRSAFDRRESSTPLPRTELAAAAACERLADAAPSDRAAAAWAESTAPAPSFVAQARIDTPLGAMTLAATERGLAGAWFDGQRQHPGALAAPTDASHRWLAQAAQEFARYWASPHAPFALPLDPQGSAFQRTVWRALCGIGVGRTLSYGALASALGRASAVRAVAAAVGRNPLSIVVPCHRVIGADGSLTGYAGGLERKRALLQHEAAAA